MNNVTTVIIAIILMMGFSYSVVDAQTPKSRPAWWSTYSCNQCAFEVADTTSLVCIVKCGFGSETDFQYHAKELTEYCDGFMYTGLSTRPEYCESQSIIRYGITEPIDSDRVEVKDAAEQISIIDFAKELADMVRVPLRTTIQSLKEDISNDMYTIAPAPVHNSISEENTDAYIFDAVFDETKKVFTTEEYADVLAEITVQKQGCSTFTTNYLLGSSAVGVKKVQEFLNSIDGIQLTTVGAGSPGNETVYFGTATKNGVKKFQEMYREEVLTSVGLTRATGYWGPSTRAMANKILGCK